MAEILKKSRYPALQFPLKTSYIFQVRGSKKIPFFPYKYLVQCKKLFVYILTEGWNRVIKSPWLLNTKAG